MNESQKDGAAAPAHPQYSYAYAAENEISLVDLWIALLKLKKVFLSAFVVFLVLGLLSVTGLLPEKYQMTSTIAIGRVQVTDPNKNTVQFLNIDAPEAIISEINTALLPELTRQVAKKHGAKILSTSVSNPKNTNLIIIQNTVVESERDMAQELQRLLVENIVASQAYLALAINADAYQQLIELKDLKGQQIAKTTDSEGNSAGDSVNLLAHKIAVLEASIKMGETHANVVANLSLTASGMSKNSAYAMVIVVAAMLALFTGLLAMFRSSVQARLAEEVKS